MNLQSILDDTTATAIDAAWIVRALEPASLFGRRAFENVKPFRSGEETQAHARARHVYELAREIAAPRSEAMRETLRSAPDPLAAISRAAMGETMDDPQFLELLRFLDAAREIERVPLDEPLRALAHTLEHGRAGKFGFYLADAFDPQLGRARQSADREQAAYDSARGRISLRIMKELGRDDMPSGEFIVMREGAAALPQGVRVVREAPTYFLCEIELDEPALEALERRDAAAAAVAAAERNVRIHLSESVRTCARDLERLLEDLAQLDVDLAQVRFTQAYDCVPATPAPRPCLQFRNASYLPLRAQLQSQNRTYEPVSIDLQDAAVLTGPNMGGKSAALRTCAFVAVLAAFGVPVPASSVTCSLFDEISWLGIGAQEDTGGLLSSFASEVVRLRELLSRPAPQMLVLLDEFARTTTPHEGRALLVALLHGLRRRGRLAFAATHLAGVATQAQAAHFAVRGLRDVPSVPPGADLSEALSALAASMDYSLQAVSEDAPPTADAIALAQILGLDEDIVAEAKESVWIR